MTASVDPQTVILDEKRFARDLSASTSLSRTTFTIVAGYVAFVLLVVIGAWSLIAQDRVRQLRLQTAELASLSRALDEHISRTFGDVDTALRSMSTVMALEGAIAQDFFSVRLHSELTEWVTRTPQAAVFAVFDAEGKSLDMIRQINASETLGPAHPSLSLWKRDPISYLRIQPPIKDAQDRWYLPVERPTRKTSGDLAGVQTALLDLQYFEDFHRDIRLTPNDNITLLTRDGYLLLNLPNQPQQTERDWSNLLAKAGKLESNATVFDLTFEENGAQRMGVFRRIAGYPLIVAVSRPVSVALTGFNQMRNRVLLGAAALIVLLGVLVWVLHTDARRREAARQALGRMNATLEDRVRRRTAELEQSNRELIAFSYSISHDLRAPLRAINGFTHALKEDYGEQLDSQGKDFLDRVYRASLRMGELIDELLKLANISRAPLNWRSVDLSTLAYEIVDELRHAHPDREVVFETQEEPLVAEGDETLLRNALYNLLHNAWKFTRSRRPGVITLTSGKIGDFVQYVVADNGVGFEIAHAKRLFQPFQQLHTNQGYGGTGIGLASVRRIIERHGGTVRAEAEPEHGARIIFTLPLRAKVIRRQRGNR